jgi:hypothetical protein
MENGKPPNLKWNEWKEGSPQQVVAEMAIGLLNALAVVLQETDGAAVQSGFTMEIDGSLSLKADMVLFWKAQSSSNN